MACHKLPLPLWGPSVGPIPHPMYVVHSSAPTLSLGFFLSYYKVSQTRAGGCAPPAHKNFLLCRIIDSPPFPLPLLPLGTPPCICRHNLLAATAALGSMVVIQGCLGRTLATLHPCSTLGNLGQHAWEVGPLYPMVCRCLTCLCLPACRAPEVV